MTDRWQDNASIAIGMLAAQGGIKGLIAVAIVAASIRARDDTARQYDSHGPREDGWIPEQDWRWISGICLRHLRESGQVPDRPPAEVVGGYWASYDEIRALALAELRPAALRAHRRLALIDRRMGARP